MNSITLSSSFYFSSAIIHISINNFLSSSFLPIKLLNMCSNIFIVSSINLFLMYLIFLTPRNVSMINFCKPVVLSLNIDCTYSEFSIKFLIISNSCFILYPIFISTLPFPDKINFLFSDSCIYNIPINSLSKI